MDKNFLEFWGNFLLNSAKSQKQLEDMQGWVKQSLKGFDDITALFLKSLGLDKAADGNFDFFAAWKKAQENLSESFMTGKNQEQFEGMKTWMQQSSQGLQEMTALFTRIYGLDKIKEGSPDLFSAYKKAQKDFKQSFDDFLALLGGVPKEEHLALVRRYEELKENLASHQETIKHLRLLMSESKMRDQGEMTKQFDDLIKKQSDQFQKLVDNFTKTLKKNSTAQDAKKS